MAPCGSVSSSAQQPPRACPYRHQNFIWISAPATSHLTACHRRPHDRASFFADSRAPRTSDSRG